jgi:hypothetical protein
MYSPSRLCRSCSVASAWPRRLANGGWRGPVWPGSRAPAGKVGRRASSEIVATARPRPRGGGLANGWPLVNWSMGNSSVEALCLRPRARERSHTGVATQQQPQGAPRQLPARLLVRDGKTTRHRDAGSCRADAPRGARQRPRQNGAPHRPSLAAGRPRRRYASIVDERRARPPCRAGGDGSAAPCGSAS